MGFRMHAGVLLFTALQLQLVVGSIIECPMESAACLRRCLSERTILSSGCPRGRVCCLRKTNKTEIASPLGTLSIGNETYHYIRDWLKDSIQQQQALQDADEGSPDYSSWSYLRNKSQNNWIPKAEIIATEKWSHLGVELPVDIKSVRNSTGKVHLEAVDDEDGKLMDYNTWMRFLDFLFNSTKNDKRKLNRDKGNQVYDCGDAEDRLRCRRICPEGRKVAEKTCPFNRVCCRGKPSSIYSPLRRAPFYKSTTPQPVQEQQVFNYLVNRWNDSDPIRVVGIEEESNVIPPARPSEPSKTPSNIEDNNIIPEESLRKSVKYCKKYQELTIDYLHAMPLLPEFMPFTLPMDNCLPLFMPLIVGGQNVTRGEFPHMAAVGYQKDDFTDYLCGGTLISNKFVLTAAHCAKTKWGPPVTVMLGSTQLYSEESIEIPVKRIVPHPDYLPPSYYHDIALLELAEEVEFSQTLRPACLALPGTEAQEAGSVAIATGWGKTGFARLSSMHLKKVPLKVIGNTKCEEYYASDIRQPALREGINDKLMCATGHASDYHDTCQGDSGGPLQAFLPGHNCMLEVVAVTSFGKTCGTAIPGVYTKIEPYLSWIEEIVWP